MKKKIFVSCLALSLISSLFAFTNVEYKKSKAENANYDFLANKTETIYNDDTGLITGKANAIAELENGSIWIGQYAGLTRYDSVNFNTYYKSGDIDLSGVTSLLASGNDLYVGTQHGLITYKNNKFTMIDGLTTGVTSFVKNEKGVYVATSNGAYLLDANNTISKVFDGNCIKVFASNNDTYFVTDSNVCYKGKDEIVSGEVAVKSGTYGNNHLYLGGKKGEFVVDGNVVATLTSNKPINKILVNDENVFIGADDGLYIYENNSLSKIGGISLTSNIEDIMVDYQKNLWVVSSSSGISKISSNSFTDVFFKYNIEERIVNKVNFYQGLMYIATDSGVLCIDEANNNQVSNVFVNGLLTERTRDLVIYKDKLYAAVYDSSSQYLVSFDGTNYVQYGKENFVEEGKTPIDNCGQVRSLCVANNNLYIGTNYGLTCFDGTNFKTLHTSGRPLYVYSDGANVFACLENKGVLRVNYSLEQEFTIPGTESTTFLKCFKLNNGGMLLSSNNSLYLYKDNQTKKVNIPFVGSIVEIFERQNELYIGCDTGIYIFPESEVENNEINYKLLGKNNGLKHSINSNASGYYDSTNDKYYFSAKGTVYIYNFSASEINATEIKIDFNEILIDGESYNDPHVQLKTNSKRLTFSISYFNFSIKSDYVVNYMLEGFDKEYRQDSINNLQSITYMNLSGGNYKFKLFVSDSKGNQVSNLISISVTKAKQFHELPWAMALLVLAAIAVMGGVAMLIVKINIRAAIKKQNEYKKITLESIEAIARTIDAKDSYTNGHSMRVGKYSRLIAQKLNLPEEEVNNIYYIALLHDIGKIGIPDNILNKPGKLTDEEFAIMKSHTTRGAKILETISTIPQICNGAKYHHEKYDGSGYPEHLKGEEIPFIARIICCADCYDAMATLRSYKPPYGNEKIISEFERCAGTQFDPEIAKITIELINEGALEEKE